MALKRRKRKRYEDGTNELGNENTNARLLEETAALEEV